MTERRAALRAAVIEQLGQRLLIWAGLRGDDAESLSDLPQFDASFTIINAYHARPLRSSVAYEDLTGVRVDLERWDVDEHLGDEATVHFRRGLLRAMSVPCALLPYRPSQFLSALAFARQDRCLNLGLFGSQQFAFEHKPWVESAIEAMGLPTLQWRYIADEDQLDAERLLAEGPIMVRRSRTSGGEGLVRVTTATELAAAWPRQAEAFASVSRYVPNALPVNIGATVWRDGVSVHLPSVQLIGIAECVSREFGYCGNDFSIVRDFDDSWLDALEDSTRAVGEWLRAHGYRGTFGADFLMVGGVPVFTEVNPRFQGSTRASAQLSVETGEPCLLLEHIAAMLGLARPAQAPLRDRVRVLPPLSQIVLHNTTDDDVRYDVGGLRSELREAQGDVRMDAALPDAVRCQPGATLARFALRSGVTRTGYDLREDVRAAIVRSSRHGQAVVAERTV